MQPESTAPRGMRVAFVTSALSRQGFGVSAVVEELSRSLHDASVEIAVFGLEDSDWRDGGHDVWRGAPAQAFPVRGPNRLGYAPLFLKTLRAWSPDIVHLHGLWTYPSLAVWRWARASGKPYIVSAHGMLEPWALAQARFKKHVVAAMFHDAVLKNAAMLHALCDQEAHTFSEYGLTQPIEVIPNGVSPPADLHGTTPRLPKDIAADKKIILYLGRLHQGKNLHNLIEAWAATLATGQFHDWVLAIAGSQENSYARGLAENVDKFGITDSVVFLGPLFGAEKDAAFRRAEAFVLPSLSEGLPIVVLEAWSYGLPVLMTEKCNLSIGFTTGAAVRLSLDQSSMQRELNALLMSTSKELRAIGKQGRKLANDHFSWTNISSRYVEVYRSAIANSRNDNNGAST